jgi:exosortase A-associated hydrolase 1
MAPLKYTEHALTFACRNEVLVGILAKPERASNVGILIIVGGPQYRVGSHRQFVQLARALATQGVPALRFDSRGMGDATGAMQSFEDNGPDVAAAIESFQVQCPEVAKIVLWGICDAASVALAYWHATQDSRIAGMALLNPWVRTEAGLAKAHIKHYYGQRLLDRRFWNRVLRGEIALASTLGALARTLATARTNRQNDSTAEATEFQDRMAEGLRSFQGPVLLILSGRDLTAKEFIEYCQSSARWAGLLERGNVARHDLPDADHTFSAASSARDVEVHTLAWLRRFFP